LNPDDEKENDSIYGKPSTKRRLTNHSARRFMLQKLDDKGVEHNHIKQVTMIFFFIPLRQYICLKFTCKW